MALFRPPKDLLVLLLIALAGATIYGNFFFDRTLENTLEQALESVTGATVEIDDLKFYSRGPSLSMEGIKIADRQDPLRNLIEIGRLGFHVEAKPLFWRSLFLKDLFVGDIQFDTKRRVAARVFSRDPARSEWIISVVRNLQDHLDAPPLLQVLAGKESAQGLLPYLDFQPLKELAQMRTNIDSVSQSWNLFKKKFETQLNSASQLDRTPDESSESEKRLNSIKGSLDSIATAVYDNLAKLRREVIERADSVAAQRLTPSLEATLLTVSPELATKMVFSESILHNADRLLQYIDMARRVLPGRYQIAENTKMENPRRFVGQDILLPLTDGPARFGIAKIEVECPPRGQTKTRDVFVRGTIRGYSLDSQQSDSRVSFRMRTKDDQPKMVVVMGALDHSGVTPFEQFQVGISGTNMLRLDLRNRPFLPSEILIDRGDLSGNFELVGSEFNAHFSLASSKTRFSFTNTDDGEALLWRQIRKALESQERFNLSAVMLTSDTEPQFQLRSRVGGLIAAPLQEAVQDLLEREYPNFATAIPKYLANEVSDLSALIDRQKKRFESEVIVLKARLLK